MNVDEEARAEGYRRTQTARAAAVRARERALAGDQAAKVGLLERTCARLDFDRGWSAEEEFSCP